MTLILSCFTEEFAIQAMDRRVTRVDRRLVDDARNKGVSVNGQYVVGYSGLAEINGEHTDAFVARTLAEASVKSNSIFDRLADAAATSISRSARLHRHWTTFVAYGWESDDKGIFRPVVYIVSNAVQEDGKLGSKVHRRFGCIDTRFSNLDAGGRGGFIGPPVGVSPPRAVLRRLHRDFGNALDRAVGPKDIARLLGDAIRSTAKIDSRVGTNIAILIQPKPVSTDLSNIMMATVKTNTARSGSNAAASYLLTDESDDLMWQTPSMVTNGWALTEIQHIRQGSKIAVQCRVLREGRGIAGLAIGDPEGTHLMLEVLPGGAKRIRTVEPGKPDSVQVAVPTGPVRRLEYPARKK